MGPNSIMVAYMEPLGNSGVPQFLSDVERQPQVLDEIVGKRRGARV